MEFIVPTVSLVLASIIWGLRLEGRVNKTDQKIDDKEKLDAVRTEGLTDLLEAKFDGVSQRLERIEKAMNGSLYGHR